ncbi:MAG: response regulator [Rhodospirillales bacterium]|jgi:two-component system chemotaxis response regulator CheY|nr:response regulator [Rhodospirillales bacterium]|tara:strand:- start:49 stop:894 length:846 start_codon:yes stop_codon:yes gene_type:complete
MSLFEKFGIDFSNFRVLLVEDSEFALNLEKLGLQELGFKTVIVARDGKEAYETLEHFEHINLIVSDWNMPNLNGLELLKASRERWPGVPFIMLTVNDTVEHVAEARKVGVDAYLVKPFSLDGLRHKIIVAIRRRLARGGDQVDEDDVVYLDVLEQIESLVEEVGDDEELAVNKPVNQFEGAIERVLFNAENREENMKELLDSAKAVEALGGEHEKLIKAITDQLSEFIDAILQPNAMQIEVIKLHVEAIQAILAGRLEGATGFDGNILIEGLQMAVNKAGD